MDGAESLLRRVRVFGQQIHNHDRLAYAVGGGVDQETATRDFLVNTEMRLGAELRD